MLQERDGGREGNGNARGGERQAKEENGNCKGKRHETSGGEGREWRGGAATKRDGREGGIRKRERARENEGVGGGKVREIAKRCTKSIDTP